MSQQPQKRKISYLSLRGGVIVIGLVLLVAFSLFAYAYPRATADLLLQMHAPRLAYAAGNADPNILYSLGMYHFSSLDGSYDIHQAEKYFDELENVFPEHERVLHQQARIDFLNGNFARALWRINAQIENHGEAVMAAYYMRGLIHGFRGEYKEAADDFFAYLEWDAMNWAAVNDLLWVLLAGGESERALRISSHAAEIFPTNPWILTAHATALHIAGRVEESQEVALRADRAAQTLTARDWLVAYPGNDPRVALVGVTAMQRAVKNNVHTLFVVENDREVYAE